MRRHSVSGQTRVGDVLYRYELGEVLLIKEMLGVDIRWWYFVLAQMRKALSIPDMNYLPRYADPLYVYSIHC